MRALTLFLVALCGTAPHARADRLTDEGRRLERVARTRGGVPGGAVELMRLAELANWLPQGWVETRLRAAATQRRRAPLVRAVAWWLLRTRARNHLDRAPAREAREALGLLTGFAFRRGTAPTPTLDLDPQGWRTYPADLGEGELWLDAVLRPARDTVATLATRLVLPKGGPAVLRLGYDDTVTVWLNGDEIYKSAGPHRAWLDQAAVPYHLAQLPGAPQVRAGAGLFVAQGHVDRLAAEAAVAAAMAQRRQHQGGERLRRHGCR